MRTLRIISRKESAINSKKRNFKRRNNCNCQGRLSIVGIGPGGLEHLSHRARRLLDKSQVIIGYKTYIKLLGDLTQGKEVISSGMTQEITRAKQAIGKALEGKGVCLISSGDPGIYGMAQVILELFKKSDAKKVKIEVVPGITAALACASLLGAPLAQDFAVISLSDIMIDLEEIEKKIREAAKGDFVIVLYNPKSKFRIKPLERAWSIIAQYRAPCTPVGIVKNAYRQGEKVRIIFLKDRSLLKDVDMATTIIVGNSKTFVKNGYMITARGYKI